MHRACVKTATQITLRAQHGRLNYVGQPHEFISHGLHDFMDGDRNL